METKRIPEKVFCRVCKRKTNHGIILTHNKESQYPQDDFQWWFGYHIVECLGCDNVAFVKEYGDETMVDFDEIEGSKYLFDYKVYPEEPKNWKNAKYKFHTNKEFKDCPETIYSMYSQIVAAFNMEFYLLSAVGLRILVEGLCKDLGINDGYVLNEEGNKIKQKGSEEISRRSNLEGKINGLIEEGVVVKSQADILHQIRLLGNSSAHELKDPTRKTVSLGITILESILEQIYEFKNYQLK